MKRATRHGASRILVNDGEKSRASLSPRGEETVQRKWSNFFRRAHTRATPPPTRAHERRRNELYSLRVRDESVLIKAGRRASVSQPPMKPRHSKRRVTRRHGVAKGCGNRERERERERERDETRRREMRVEGKEWRGEDEKERVWRVGEGTL